MKIIYIHDTLADIGGLERILVQKMNYLAEKPGYEVYLVTSSQGNHPISFPLSPKVKHTDLNIRFHTQYQYPFPQRIRIKYQMNRSYRKSLQELVDAVDPDILVGTTIWKSDVICALDGRAKKVIESHCAKSYTTIVEGFTQGYIKDILNKAMTWQRFRYTEKKCDTIVALTYNDASAWKNAPQVCVVPNMIEYIPEESSTCHAHRVIAAGRLTYQKGFDRLIDAWKSVHQKHPDWILDIYGEGYYKEKLQRQIEENLLEGNVTIHPFTSDIFREYLHSSIFVLSSNYEGFGLVLIEAMACGIPCVSFDCLHGPADIIGDKEDGILVPNGDIDAMATALCHLIENADIRTAYGQKAKENIKRFLPENIMPKWEELFNRLAN